MKRLKKGSHGKWDKWSDWEPGQELPDDRAEWQKIEDSSSSQAITISVTGILSRLKRFLLGNG